jgi:hypothetical protein
VVRLVPGLTIPGTFHALGGDGNGHFSPVPASVMSCAQLATVPALGRGPAGAATAAFPAAALGEYGVFDGSILTGITWPAANVPAARLDTLGVDSIYVGTDGSTAQAAAIAGATRQEAAEAICVTFLMKGGPATFYGPPAYDAFCEFAKARETGEHTA